MREERPGVEVVELVAVWAVGRGLRRGADSGRGVKVRPGAGAVPGAGQGALRRGGSEEGGAARASVAGGLKE